MCINFQGIFSKTTMHLAKMCLEVFDLLFESRIVVLGTEPILVI